jgi:hypothetical protein
MNESYEFQVNEMKKHSYEFYLGLARGDDPLTYTFSDNDNETVFQVEITAKIPKKIKGVLVQFYFCSDHGKWMCSSDYSPTYLITEDGSWKDSSYDGSEYRE